MSNLVRGISLRVFLVGFLATASCQHSPLSHERLPSNDADSTAESAVFDARESIAQMVQNRNSQRLGQLFLAARIAQTLVASFDERVAALKSEADSEALMRSRLYCKLQRTRQLYESVEDKLLGAVAAANAQGADGWFFAEFQKFAERDVAAQAAAANLLRFFALHDVEVCGSAKCFERRYGGRVKLPFPYVDSRRFLAFVRANRAEIARYSQAQPSDMAPGECFSGGAREPNQAGAYDWKNRSHVKAGLESGEFVITYDDGPHTSNTEQLMRMWAQSDFPKPTFFWLTKNAVVMPAIVADAQESGFPVGLHSERHADLGTLAKAGSPADFNKVDREIFGAETADLPDGEFESWKQKTLDREIPAAAKTLTKIARRADSNYKLKYFRLPYGSGMKNDMIGARLAALDVEHFFWAVDSLDWQDHNPDSVYERVTGQMQAVQRGIILFHDVQPPTVAVSQMLLELFKSDGRWKPVSITRTLAP